MKSEYYEPYALAEERHWWFAARRTIIRSVLRTLDLAPGANLLEVGCASGGNLEMLGEFGAVKACEYDVTTLELARRLHPGVEIERCELPEVVPFGEEKYDVIGVFDVLEHVEADAAALRSLRERLKPGGRVVLTVPAFRWLWSAHDEINQHFRRYTRQEMVARLREAGLEPAHASYFNLILMPIILLARLASDALRRDPAEQLEPPLPWVNRTLEVIFSSERHVVSRCGLPLGVSLLVVARAAR